MIFTFWEGKLPEYLKLCLNTWKFPYIILNYNNLSLYTEKLPEKVKQLSLQKVADYVRVHVLRDSGGIWIDTDTIMLNDKLPNALILGDNINRTNTIGFLNANAIINSDIFIQWATFQDSVINDLKDMPNGDTTNWDIIGNKFTNNYLLNHKEIFIDSIEDKWVETYMIKENIPRDSKYKLFYFKTNYTLKDINNTNMLMLHNSWTPNWYKELSIEEVLKNKCTLSNILRELNV